MINFIVVGIIYSSCLHKFLELVLGCFTISPWFLIFSTLSHNRAHTICRQTRSKLHATGVVSTFGSIQHVLHYPRLPDTCAMPHEAMKNRTPIPKSLYRSSLMFLQLCLTKLHRVFLLKCCKNPGGAGNQIITVIQSMYVWSGYAAHVPINYVEVLYVHYFTELEHNGVDTSCREAFIDLSNPTKVTMFHGIAK